MEWDEIEDLFVKKILNVWFWKEKEQFSQNIKNIIKFYIYKSKLNKK